MTLHHTDHNWKASAEDDHTVVPRSNESAVLDGTTLTVELPAISWSMLRLAATREADA